MLAKVLTSQLGRTVRDETGLDGVFDFLLEWDPGVDSTSGEGLPAVFPDGRARASIFTAIQEQLGLKLEGRKEPVDVLVIDRVERTPTEN
jgi:uncharacterized protein (TIGR03435 family)